MFWLLHSPHDHADHGRVGLATVVQEGDRLQCQNWQCRAVPCRTLVVEDAEPGRGLRREAGWQDRRGQPDLGTAASGIELPHDRDHDVRSTPVRPIEQVVALADAELRDGRRAIDPQRAALRINKA